MKRKDDTPKMQYTADQLDIAIAHLSKACDAAEKQALGSRDELRVILSRLREIAEGVEILADMGA